MNGKVGWNGCVYVWVWGKDWKKAVSKVQALILEEEEGSRKKKKKKKKKKY